MITKILKLGVVAGLAITAAATAAHATTLRVSITNNAGDSGLSLTPLYFAFHDGGFTGFNVGQAASPGLELLAEEGDFGLIRDERVAATTNSAGVVTSQGGALTAPGSPFTSAGIPPVIEPGENSSVDLNVDATNRFFNYFSMVIPSNDLFIGREGLGAEVFDMAGNFLGNQTFQITGANIWDAGTEVNNNSGAAFNTAGGAGTDENGVVTLAGSSALNALTGQTGANGLTIGGSPVAFSATISVSEVPLPAGAPLVLTGLGLLGFMRARKKKA
ncbi:MAG: spondin domain-containing protein [Pseudomonadota bacterium]